MEYRSGSIGRVLMIRFDHGDDLLEGLKEVVKKEGVKSSWFQILGGLRQAEVVTGPEEPVMPPTPVWSQVDEARETLGTGSIHMDGEEPVIHLHGALGHHGETLTCCIRKNSKVIDGLAKSNQIMLVGAMNDIRHGKVSFFDENGKDL